MTYTHEQIVAACKNIGYDLTCGACAAIFFTGIGLPGETHTCKKESTMDENKLNQMQKEELRKVKDLHIPYIKEVRIRNTPAGDLIVEIDTSGAYWEHEVNTYQWNGATWYFVCRTQTGKEYK